MALPIREAFTARAIAAAFDNYLLTQSEPPYLGRALFGTMKQQGLDLKFIKGQNGMVTELKASAFDALAPLRDPIGFKTIENEMPFFRESYMVSEKDRQDYTSYLANDDYARQILQNIMLRPIDLIRGADVVPERMIWQLLAPTDGIPRISIEVEGDANQQYYINYTADNGTAWKAANYTALSGTSLWTAAATATPIADIIAMQKKQENAHGQVIDTVIMNSTTWGYVVAAEDTKKQVMGAIAYNAGIMLNDADVVSFLRNNYGISIVVYNKKYQSATGTARTFIPDGMVVGLSRAVKLGDVVYGTTPEELDGDKTSGEIAVVNTGVAVNTYYTNHPVQQHCVVSEIVLPSYPNMDSVCLMKTA